MSASELGLSRDVRLRPKANVKRTATLASRLAGPMGERHFFFGQQMTRTGKRDIVAGSSVGLMFVGVIILPSSRLGFIPIAIGGLAVLAMIVMEWLPRS